ncbi:MAG: CCA tRNA nucleotidyltransferase [Thermoplasmata archaeon]|nr:CCA tRNA nucleotidyltransferase [Thermoplasmata archaeon]
MVSASEAGATASMADRIETEVLARISPSEDLLRRLEGVRERLLHRAAEAAQHRASPIVRSLIAGSAARGTFLVDRLDIDLFLLFPPTLDREALEREGLGLARDLLEQPEMRYAEHPYLRGKFEGFEVDAVPGYAITDPSKPLSAVDRTPFHQAYLEARSTPRSLGEVRLSKQFLRALRIYGSEARTGGFSGYLVELLVLKFGSLRGLLQSARGWSIPHRLESHPEAKPRVPDDVALIFDDPVDPHRNVATALSRRNLALFILAAAAYLDRPSADAFTVPPVASLSLPDARARIAERGTHVAALTLPRPALVDDVLYPQIRKAERALGEAAARGGFDLLGTAGAAGPESIVLLVEVSQAQLPSVRVHPGPPVGMDRSDSFLQKWSRADAPVLQGPYVTADGRIAVDARRERRTLEQVLDGALDQLPLGRDLRSAPRDARTIRPLDACRESEELSHALGELLDKRLPWMRRPRT